MPRKQTDICKAYRKEENTVMTEQVAYIASDILKQPVISGTATYCKIAGMDVAAKTGTTTVSKRVNGRKIETYNGFLITFAPYEKPEIAVCVSVEGAGSGGSTAPIASAIMEHYFAEKDTQENMQYENSLLK